MEQTYISYILLGLFWLIYFLLHSWLSSFRLKEKVQEGWGWSPRQYRLAYVLFSTIGLVAIWIFVIQIPIIKLLPMKKPIRGLGLLLASWGAILMWRTFRSYSLKAFVGLTEEGKPKLETKGLHNWVRHPLYAGLILLVLGYWLYVPYLSHLVTMLCIFGYLPFGIHSEEKKLKKQFGEAYAQYRQEVPAIFPNLRKHFG